MRLVVDDAASGLPTAAGDATLAPTQDEVDDGAGGSFLEAAHRANVTALTVAAWAFITIAIIAHSSFRWLVTKPVENWTTVFLSLTLQALPFLVLGVVVSAAISAFVPASWLV
jgi:uncharacterized membrane protein YraQ (UPF0718 family)